MKVTIYWLIEKQQRILHVHLPIRAIKRLLVIKFIVGFFFIGGYASDSLLFELGNSLTEKEIDSVNNEAWNYIYKDLEKYGRLGSIALNASQELDYLFGYCESFQIIGTYYFQKGKLDSALVFYDKALEKREKYGNSTLISGTINNIANIYKSKGQYLLALEQYILANTYLSNSAKLAKAKIQDNISSIYIEIGKYSEALVNNQNALNLLEKESEYPDNYWRLKVNEAVIYELMHDDEKALHLYNEIEEVFIKDGDLLNLGKVKNNLGTIYLKEGDVVKAIKKYQEAQKYYEVMKYSFGLAGVYQNLGIAYKLNGDYNNSKKYFESSVEKWIELGNEQKLAESLVNLGNMHLTFGDYGEARIVFQKAEALKPENLLLQSELYGGQALVLANLKLYEQSFSIQLRYQSIRDSIEMERIKWRNLESEIRSKQFHLELVQKEKDLLEEKIQRQNFLKKAFLAGLLLFSALLFSVYLNLRNRRRRINIEEETLQKRKEVEKLLKDQELISIRNILEIQEKERKRIAQDLHDRLGSMLSMVKLHFQKTNKNIEILKVANDQEYARANKLLDDACDEVRKIAHNLTSGALKNFGLVAALEELRTTLVNTGKYEVELVTHQFEERLLVEYEVAIYRIVQELIANILRHAEATEISIQVIRKSNLLHIAVEDNGKGFEKANESELTGMGLKNIESRLFAIDGSMKIDSHIERGTSVFIDIPLK